MSLFQKDCHAGNVLSGIHAFQAVRTWIPAWVDQLIQLYGRMTVQAALFNVELDRIMQIFFKNQNEAAAFHERFSSCI